LPDDASADADNAPWTRPGVLVAQAGRCGGVLAEARVQSSRPPSEARSASFCDKLTHVAS